MVVFNLYIFNRQGICIHYREWSRPKDVKHGAGSQQDDQKQLFGLLWTMNNFCSTMNPRETSKPQLGQPRRIGEGCSFKSFTTTTYKCHYLELPSGTKLALNTTRDIGDLRDLLLMLNDLLVDRVVKSPTYEPGAPFKVEQFDTGVDAILGQRNLLGSV